MRFLKKCIATLVVLGILGSLSSVQNIRSVQQGIEIQWMG